MNQKINLDEFNLNLDELSIYDTFGIIVDKMNRNFREIQANGGGPKGGRGPIGPPNCRGKAGPPGRNGESIHEEWVAKTAINGCLNPDEYYQYHENEQSVNTNKLIVNKYANKSILLTNLSITDSENVRINDIDELNLSYEKVSSIVADYKLKIYNSDGDGTGKHIHLMNSLAASLNPEYLCNSGWTVSADIALNTNEEILRIKGRKNSNIVGHTNQIELTTDLASLRRSKYSQKLTFDAGNTLVANVACKYELTSQTKDNLVSIPDRTGFASIWEKTNEHGEVWELIDESELVIMSLVYNTGSGNTALTHEDVLPVYLADGSYIRFKRNNNWVLVDYRFGMSATTPGDTFKLVNFSTKVDLSTVACRTIGWHPSTVMVNEAINDNDAESFFGFFKIDSSKINNNSNPETFVITNKFASNYFEANYDATITNYWITGQIWATVDNCDIIEIVQEDICVTDLEITQG